MSQLNSMGKLGIKLEVVEWNSILMATDAEVDDFMIAHPEYEYPAIPATQVSYGWLLWFREKRRKNICYNRIKRKGEVLNENSQNGTSSNQRRAVEGF